MPNWARLVAGVPRLSRAVLPRLPRLSAAVAGGLLLCASFPPLDWWAAAVVAFALLAWVLTRSSTTLSGGLGYGFLFGVAFYLPLLAWLRTLGVLLWIALAMVCAVFAALFGVLAVVVRRLPGWPLWFALLWVAQEWLKSIVPFGGFPWGVVAAGQTGGPLLPLARLGGVPLLSTAVLLVGGSVTALALEIAARLARPTDSDITAATPPAVVLPGVCICLVLFTAVVLWPQVRHSGNGSANEPAVTVAVVQGNVSLHDHVRETMRLADDVHAGRAPQPQLVVWPAGVSERAPEIDPLHDPEASQQISAAAEAIGAPILVGAVLRAPGGTPGNPLSTNSVIVWNPGTGPADRHDAQIAQPFAEYLPWRGFFRHLSARADWPRHFVPGSNTGLVHAAGFPVGVTTGWEMIFDRALPASVRNGAQLLAVSANNLNGAHSASANRQMSEQQLAFAKVRAVEHDRYVVVAGDTGISALVTPDGRELASTGFSAAAYLDVPVRLETTLTPATRWGPVVPWVLVGAAGTALLAAIGHNSWFAGWFARSVRRRSRPAKDPQPDEGDRPAAPSGPDRGAT